MLAELSGLSARAIAAEAQQAQCADAERRPVAFDDRDPGAAPAGVMKLTRAGKA